MRDCRVCAGNTRGPRGLHCDWCGEHVYWVRAANGEVFLVSIIGGKRWCPDAP